MATYTAVAGGGNWSNNATWGGGGHPVAGDTAVINATMTGTVTVDAAAACAVLNLTNNGGTLAFGNFNITVTGGVTLGGAITAGTGGLTLTTTQTLTSNGVTFPGKFNNTGGSATFTLSGNWVNTGLVTFANSTLTPTTSETFTCNGGMTASAAVSGTATIILGGGTWSGGGQVKNSLTIAGDVTVSSSVNYGNTASSTLTYSSGTVTTTGSTLTLTAACTLNTNGISWNNITLAGGTTTYTLSSSLTCTGTMSMVGGVSYTFSGAYNISVGTLANGVTSTAANFILVASQTLTISTSIQLDRAVTVKSATGSSLTNLVYNGTPANCKVVGCLFTDVDASGGNPIYNYLGSTLLRTIGIYNVDASNLKSTGVWGPGTVAQESGALARGGSGTAVKLSPTSATDPLLWTFLVPATASTAFTLGIWHRITSSFPGSMTVTVYDTDNTTQLVNAGSVTLTDDGVYHQYTSGSLTPTATGFCRVVIKILGASGSIYLDDVSAV